AAQPLRLVRSHQHRLRGHRHVVSSTRSPANSTPENYLRANRLRGMDDAIDGILAQWQRERPDLDLTPIGVVGRIMQLSAVLTGRMARAQARYGFRPGEFDVLTTLRRAAPPHTLTPSELADSLMMSRAGMTKRLDRLEADGLVTRSLDAADRRSFRVSLS